MVRFRHSVILEPVPRGWFDDNVELGHDIVTEHLGSEAIPLGGGTHLAPGAWYSTDEFTVTVNSWNRRAETSGRLNLAGDEFVAIGSFRLVSASAPRLAEVDADVRLVLPRGTRWLARFRGGVRADTDRWWTGRTQDGGEPAIQGWVRHSTARLSFEITSATAPDGRWQVTVDGTIRPRGVLGPLTAVVLLAVRSKVRRELREGMDKFAEDWNQEVPALLAASPDELRERLVTELTDGMP